MIGARLSTIRVPPARGCKTCMTNALKGMVLLCGLLTVAACDESPTSPNSPLDTNFTLGPGARQVVEPNGLTLQLDTVVNDSRCPASAICITAGDATIAVQVRVRDTPFARHDLSLVAGSTLVAGTYTIRFTTLSPYPGLQPMPIPPADYRATFHVTRP